MNVRVAYFSSTGNTRRVAEAIAAELEVEALPISAVGNSQEPTELLLLGGAVYANHGHGLHASLKAFIDGLDASKVQRAAIFATGFIQSEAISMMRWRLAKMNIPVADESFFCLGRFALFNIGHPSREDLERAKKFARNIVGSR